MPAPRSELTVPDPGRRADLGDFVARVVRLDPAASVRLRGSGATVTAWAGTPFEVLATRAVPGALIPADQAVPAMALLSALSVDRAGTIDPGPAAPWRAELPPPDGWGPATDVPAVELAGLLEQGLAEVRESGDPHGPSAALLDRAVLRLPDPRGAPVRVPMRCLFALSGLGLLDGDPSAAPVRVAATRSWLRLDTPAGGVVRRRVVALPLLL